MSATGSEGRGALEATVEFSYDRDQLARLAGDLPLAGLLNLESPERQTMRLTVAVDSWQLDLDEPTVFGSGMTVIRHRDGAAEYLDHGTKVRLSLVEQDIPPAAVRSPGRWHVSDPGRGDEPIEVALDDPVSGEHWVQRIHTGPPSLDPELVLSFAEALLGGGGVGETSHYPLREIARILVRRGLPSEITLHADGADEASSRITLTYRELDAEASAPSRDGYDDLRDPEMQSRWTEPGPGLREVRARDLDELRDFDNGGDSEHRALMMIRDGGPDREPDSEPETDRPTDTRPPPAITTNAASMALRIEQRLLDDIRRTINALAAHFTDFRSNGTELVIPWLAELVVDARLLDPVVQDPATMMGSRTKTKPGTGLAALLHEDGASDTPESVKIYQPNGHGFVDRMAAARARDYLATNAIPESVLSVLSAADKVDIDDVLTGSAPPDKRIEWLTGAVRRRLIGAVAFEDIGTLRFSLRRLSDPINFSELYLVQLGNIHISLGLPEATWTDDVPPIPLEAPLVTVLQCRNGGTVAGTLSVDYLRVDADLIRTPLPLYWVLLVAGSPLIPVFFPQFAWVIPILWSISVFLVYDFSDLLLEAKPLGATISVSFAPRLPTLALRPSVSVRMTGSIRVRMLSQVPDGIHQLVDFAVADLLTHFDEALKAFLEDQLRSGLQNALDLAMGGGVPGPGLGLGIVSGTAAGIEDEYIYLESCFGVPSDPLIRITPTPVSAALRFDLERDVERVFGAAGDGGRGRHYLSLAASVNAVNQAAAVLWRWGVFNALIVGGWAAAVRPLLVAPFSGPLTRIDASHRSPPVFSFPPGGPTGPHHYFDVVFPAFGVIVNRGQSSYWLFRYRITARGVFGMGAVPAGGRFLSLANIGPSVFDALIDRGSVNATLLEASHVTETTITVEEPGQDPYHPTVIRTHEEIVEDTTDWTAGAPAGWTDFGRTVFELANLGRDAGFAPRLDGFKADGHPANWPLDAATEQTYTVDGSDPDDATAQIMGVTVAGYGHLPVDWGFKQGLSFAHVEVSGAFEQLLSGELPINSFQTVDAEWIYKFWDR